MGDIQTAGKVAVITGGASGIGRALAGELARRGAEVVIADRQTQVAQEVVAAIRAAGGKASSAEVDVRSFESLKQLVDATVARCGRLDYFFNNAGIGVGGPIEAYTPADWDDVFDVNLRGVAYGVQAVYPVMIAQGFGHIINTASVAGLLPSVGTASYSASKFAVVGLSKALRVEAAYHGIRVSVLCPGAIRTPILKGGKFGRPKYEITSQERTDRFFESLHPMAPELFAHRALDAVLRDVAVIVIPGWWKLWWVIDRLVPGLTLKWATRMFAEGRRKMNLGEPGALPASDAAAAHRQQVATHDPR
jgi:NAD(P)-dependent dehydrogenase (short-subunit alcohol dehydrogenase family)